MYQGFTSTTGHELWERLGGASQRFSDVCSSVPPEGPAWRSEWTAQQVAQHLLTVVHRYTRRDFRDPSGLGSTAAEISVMNDDAMAAVAELPMEEVLSLIESEMAAVRSTMPPEMDLDETFPFHAGAAIDGAGALANLIGEFTVHGRDVALGGGLRFRVDRRDALLVMNALVQLAPSFVKRGSGNLAVALRVRGAVPWFIDIADGEATSRPLGRGDHVDAVIRGPAATLLLALYRRRSIGESIRRGMVVSGGRRPWRALAMMSMMEPV